MDKARSAPIFLLVWDGLLLKGKVFWLILFNTEDKPRNGDSQNIIFSYWVGLFWKHASVATSVQKVGQLSSVATSVQKVGQLSSVATSVQKVGLFLKTRLCCHLCPESGLISENLPLLPPLSRKWAYFWKLVSVATSVQKVDLFVKTRLCCHLCPESGLISGNSPLLSPLSRKWAYFLKTRLCCHLCPKSGLN